MRKSLALLLLLVACTKRETTVTDTATTSAAPPAAAAPATASAPPPAPAGAPLGGALNVDPAGRAKTPAMAMGSDQQPIVAWHETGKIVVKRWDGSAWQPLGGVPLNRNAQKTGETPRIAVQPDGTIFVAWRELDPTNDHSRVTAARWNGSAWEAAGDWITPAGNVSDGFDFAATPSGPVVVARERAAARVGERQVVVRRWNGSAWQQLGGGALNAVVGADVSEPPAMATFPNGDFAVAWLERMPGQPVAAHVRRWDSAQSSWRELPSIGAVDSDSILAVATSGDTLFAATTWNPGFRPVMSLAPGAASWTEVGYPDPKYANAGGVAAHRLAAAPNGGLVFLADREGKLRIDRVEGGTWSPVTDSVNPEPRRGFDPAIAVANDGKVHAAYIDTRGDTAQLMVWKN